MLSNFEIEDLCEKLDLPLIGVYSKDELNDIEPRVGSYIVNMQNSDKGDGSHWTLVKIYCNNDRDYISTSENFKVCRSLAFDSFGIGCSIEVSNFLRNFKPIAQSTRQIQDMKSDECGWYCMCLDYALEHKQHRDTYLEDFESWLHIWSKNTKKNSDILKAFFKKTPIGKLP